MNDVIIAVGSNIEPEKNITTAEKILRRQKFITKSNFTKTTPQGCDDCPNFLNGAFKIQTNLSLPSLKAYLKGIEAAMGRVRTADKNAPRNIDLDVAVFNGKIIDDDFYKYDFVRAAVREILSEAEFEMLKKGDSNAKTAILAGIGRLGEDIAASLLENDWQVCISFREGKSSEEAVNRIIQKYGREKVFTFSASLEDFAQAKGFISACLDKQGKPDMLINIASEFPKEKDHWQRWQMAKPVRNDDWQFYESNFMVARNPITALLEKADCNELCIINFGDARCMAYCTNPQCLDPYKDYGGILNFKTADICSFALDNISKSAPPRHRNPYTLAKIDIARLTQKLALECAPKIRINTIAAGPIIPSPDSNAKQAQSAIEQTALKRWGGSEAITKTVEFLFDNKFITGQILYVDGAMALYIAQKHNFNQT